MERNYISKTKIEIICPLYNAEKMIIDLNDSIKKQKNVNIVKITYILTESADKTEDILKKRKINYKKIKKSSFSHSKTREKCALNSKADILVFITQDIKIKKENWLKELIEPIVNNEAEATYSRQICDNNKSIEKYIRDYNYPTKEIVKTKDTITNEGLKTFFFSDASSAIKTSIFKQLGGYDGKDLPTNEDMYIAYKIIQNGYRIKYCPKSEVIHFHNLNSRELYKRYYLIGQFFKQNSYLNEYKISKSGYLLAITIFQKAIKNRDLKNIFIIPINMLVRYVGQRRGKK